MDDVELPRIRRSKLDKFLDQFEGTEKDLRALLVNYDTNIPVDFNNIERERHKKKLEEISDQRKSNCLDWSTPCILRKLIETTEL